MEKLARKSRERVIDVLTERLSFERAGVRLYDRVIARMRASRDEQITSMLEQMTEHRDQEEEHESWLEQQIRSLGGDPQTQTDEGCLVETESQRIEQAISDNRSEVPDLLSGLLAAKLIDNFGWEALVQLAVEADDGEARNAFDTRLRQEEKHLQFVLRAVERLSEGGAEAGLGASAP
jgi:bacterioferritin (cytochrome b1)